MWPRMTLITPGTQHRSSIVLKRHHSKMVPASNCAVSKSDGKKMSILNVKSVRIAVVLNETGHFFRDWLTTVVKEAGSHAQSATYCSQPCVHDGTLHIAISTGAIQKMNALYSHLLGLPGVTLRAPGAQHRSVVSLERHDLEIVPASNCAVSKSDAKEVLILNVKSVCIAVVPDETAHFFRNWLTGGKNANAHGQAAVYTRCSSVQDGTLRIVIPTGSVRKANAGDRYLLVNRRAHDPVPSR